MSLVRQRHTEKVVGQAKEAIRKGDYDVAWRFLEDAHIFSQPYASLHLYVHWEMLQLALKQKLFTEIWGQIMRLIVAVPGSWSGRFPPGNSGRSNVNMFKPMPLSKRIATKISQLNSLEKKRKENGGELPKHQRQHPITRN